MSSSGDMSSDSDSSEDLSGNPLEESELETHLQLLSLEAEDEDLDELSATPIFTEPVRQYGDSLETEAHQTPFTQYGLLGGLIIEESQTENNTTNKDPRVFFNTVAPSSVFICGSQGSGKSHTLSCILENFLSPSGANVLPRPLTGLMFHYDPWVSDTGGSPCEAAYLSSGNGVSVRVLCPPTNIEQIKRIYQNLPNVCVEVLQINQSDLNTKRMLDLMAVSSVQGGMPLYLHTVIRVLRDLRIQQQINGTTFNYQEFRRRVLSESLEKGQLGPLQQRLDNLESFMVKGQLSLANSRNFGSYENLNYDWTPQAGQLTIVDLSCPCVTSELACSLFNICLSLFLEQSSDIGRVVALDEAHKYMTDTPESQTLTESLLANIRLQRHLGARVIISTQEPTISPKLLDLCSVTIVHRFTSPGWLKSLTMHLAGASILAQATQRSSINDGNDDTNAGASEVGGVLQLTRNDLSAELFSQIVALRRGEALLFSPSAVIGVRKDSTKGEDVTAENCSLESPSSG